MKIFTGAIMSRENGLEIVIAAYTLQRCSEKILAYIAERSDFTFIIAYSEQFGHYLTDPTRSDNDAYECVIDETDLD